MGKIDLSIVVPLFNEEQSIEPLYRAISDAVSKIGRAYEIIFVDDGSADRTFQIAGQLAAADDNLKVIRFRHNCGQTPAMVAGIDHAKGEIIVTMDGDLQNDPSDIPNFIEKIEEGFDIVVGWRHNRQDKFVTRVLPSKIANWMISKVTGIPIRDNGCSLKAYRGSVIKNIPLYSEMHRFIPAMMSLAGVKVAEIKVKHHARQFGVSKYGLGRVYRVLLDLLFIRLVILWCERPIKSFCILASIPTIIALYCLTYATVDAFVVNTSSTVIVFGLAVLYAALALFLVALGLLGQLIYESGTIRTESFAMLTAHISVTDDTPEAIKS
jgi:glycosyltransferase involved in cell wall biosynthesis